MKKNYKPIINEAKKLEARKLKCYTGGFTLIELLVVVAVIGILASVILVSLGSARAKARDSRRVSDIKQLQNALELYFSTYGRYPKSTEFASAADTATDKFLAPKFMPAIPTDPLLGTSYKYSAAKLPTDTRASPKCLIYHIGATLEEATADSPVLKTDSDATLIGADVTACGGGTNFDATMPTNVGKTCDLVTGPDATAEYCYDLRP